MTAASMMWRYRLMLGWAQSKEWMGQRLGCRRTLISTPGKQLFQQLCEESMMLAARCIFCDGFHKRCVLLERLDAFKDSRGKDGMEASEPKAPDVDLAIIATPIDFGSQCVDRSNLCID